MIGYIIVREVTVFTQLTDGNGLLTPLLCVIVLRGNALIKFYRKVVFCRVADWNMPT